MYKLDERFYPKQLEMDFKSAHRHYLRYLNALRIIGKLGINETWLDCACGCGYGTDMLSNFTNFIHGYDIDSSAIIYANKNYKKGNVVFFDKFPTGQKYDVIFSLETIEHIDRKGGFEFLRRLVRALKSGGIIVVTTPISKNTGASPTNRFHKCEYSLEDFIGVIGQLNLKLEGVVLDETTFTDGCVKDQGYFKMLKE